MQINIYTKLLIASCASRFYRQCTKHGLGVDSHYWRPIWSPCHKTGRTGGCERGAYINERKINLFARWRSFRQLRGEPDKLPTCRKTSSRIFSKAAGASWSRHDQRTDSHTNYGRLFQRRRRRRRRRRAPFVERDLLKDFYFFPARGASTNPISSLRPRSDNYVASASYSSSVYSEENAGKWGQLEDRGGSRRKEGTAPKKEKELAR